MEQNYNKTIYACFTGYMIQAIINNFVPLLFLTFQNSYGIPLSKITLLITVNFMIQLAIDLLSITFVDRIGYRASALFAHICAAAGLAGLTVFPELTADPFYGILIAVTVYAVGGGLLEVIVSPIVEACPTDNKEKSMSLLHSFYCWGQVAVVLLSTLFFSIFGTEHWKIMTIIWALVPLLNAIAFAKAPLAPLIADKESSLPLSSLFRNGSFWALMLLMLCAGASEQAVSQWASVFAEKGLSLSKTAGDLAGPMFFGIMMGISRTFYGKYGDRIQLKQFMAASALLCIFCYLLLALSPNPVLSLLGCGFCGMSVGILWPGTFSIASATIPKGGTALFAMLALAGDLGCSAGPTLTGFVASSLHDSLQKGILAGICFPILLLLGLFLLQFINFPLFNSTHQKDGD